MSWLMHNPIADMYGPSFLFLYGCVIAATLIMSWWRLRAADPTVDLPPLPLRANPDPYEIAYLRGGENEVTRLAIFDLIQRGYLKVSENKKWWGAKDQRLSRATGHPDPRHLSPLENKVFHFCSSPCTASEIFQSDSLPKDLVGLCADYERKLQDERALCPPEVSEAARRIGRTAALIILGLGGYKLTVALVKGHSNVIFLVIMCVLSLLGLALVCRPPRLSKLGRDYLKRLQGVFDRQKPKKNGATAVPDTTLLLLVSLFGVSVLTETSYAYLGEMFHRSAAGGGAWGGGCGGGCGGGSGCGGGGCGGGGCGGCGGG